MRICMSCPAPPGSLYGNRVTALRWSRILRELGHKVSIVPAYENQPCQLLVALHARRSAASVFAFQEQHPGKPVILALTGTDVYRDIHRLQRARRALELASRLIVLQPLAVNELPANLRPKARVIYQSAERTAGGRRRTDCFDVCVVGHLRGVKDPFRAAYASRLLPKESRIRILQAGAPMEERMAQMARSEQVRNPRYRWLGGLPRGRARRLIRSSRLVVLSSRMEGGANVISEAVADGTPVLASRISGSVGLLGERYPGYFPVGDTAALAALLLRAESDCAFYANLTQWCLRLRPLFRPAAEKAAWAKLLQEVCPASRPD